MSENKSSKDVVQSVLDEAFGDRYQLSDQLGTGSYGVVFRARDAMLRRDVAVKQVRFDNLKNAAQVKDVKISVAHGVGGGTFASSGTVILTNEA